MTFEEAKSINVMIDKKGSVSRCESCKEKVEGKPQNMRRDSSAVTVVRAWSLTQVHFELSYLA
jgi:hypothetical protein